MVHPRKELRKKYTNLPSGYWRRRGKNKRQQKRRFKQWRAKKVKSNNKIRDRLTHQYNEKMSLSFLQAPNAMQSPEPTNPRFVFIDGLQTGAREQWLRTRHQQPRSRTGRSRPGKTKERWPRTKKTKKRYALVPKASKQRRLLRRAQQRLQRGNTKENPINL
jgi:hypothetical protein